MTDGELNRLALKRLREQRGAALAQAQARLKEQSRITNELLKRLAEGPKTVPALAAELGLPTATVFWQLIALKKYGKVAEGEQEGSYFQYRLSE